MKIRIRKPKRRHAHVRHVSRTGFVARANPPLVKNNATGDANNFSYEFHTGSFTMTNPLPGPANPAYSYGGNTNVQQSPAMFPAPAFPAFHKQPAPRSAPGYAIPNRAVVTAPAVSALSVVFPNRNVRKSV